MSRVPHSLHDSVEAYFRREADAYGLDASRLDVSYVLNLGGFVNHSLRVTDGRSGLHIKLATSAKGRAALRQWHRLNALLAKYHAPPVLDWIDVDGAGGLIFPVVQGTHPAATGEVVQPLMAMLARLWSDDQVAAALPKHDRATAADCFFRTYHERFTEDLHGIRSDRPAFVPIDVLDYLEAEVCRLAERIRATAAFQEELHTPVHGDLWLDNVLWQDRTHWHVLDWDDVGIGDPAVDLAMLLGPTAADLTPLKRLDEIGARLPGEAAQRIPLIGRASLLDWVIDPVADWIEADVAPAWTQQVRIEKERVHRRALALYRAQYGGD